MRNKRSRQIVTGVLAVILIIIMLAGVVAPVFAAEAGGAEALFEGEESEYDGELSNSLIVYDNNHENYRCNDLDRLIGGNSYYILVHPQADSYKYKFIWGNEDAGFYYLVGRHFEDSANGIDGTVFSVSNSSVKSLESAIKSASFLNSEGSEQEYDDTASIRLNNIPTRFKSEDELKEYLSDYFIYVVDSSDSVKYKIPVCDTYKWSTGYIKTYGSSASAITESNTVKNSEVEINSTETEIEDVSSIEEELSSEELNTMWSTDVSESIEDVESGEVAESVNEQAGVSNPDSALLFTTVDLSVVKELDNSYILHASIRTPEGVNVVSGYCKNVDTDEYLYNATLADTEFDFEIAKVGVKNVYFVVEEEMGVMRFSDTLRLGSDLNADTKVEAELKDGNFKVEFTGLPTSANKGDSITFKMSTEVPCYMKFNGVAIGRNTLGTEFDVTISDNGIYSYEAVSENGEVVSGEYEVSIFNEEGVSENPVKIIITVVVFALIVIVFIFVLYINRERRRKKDAESKKELTEEDL